MRRYQPYYEADDMSEITGGEFVLYTEAKAEIDALTEAHRLQHESLVKATEEVEKLKGQISELKEQLEPACTEAEFADLIAKPTRQASWRNRHYGAGKKD